MALLSYGYEKALLIRYFLYRKGIKKTKKLPHKVISIGNITMGGTGKTPATIALVQEALNRGFKPCILTRGYRGKKKGISFVTKGDGILLDTNEAGDEPVLMAHKLKCVPIVKGKDRYRAGLLCRDMADLYILDDGFQHLSLYRDIDILLINSRDPFGGGLFPKGLLREPLSSISRADVIVITKSGNNSEEESIISVVRTYNKHAEIFRASHEPKDVVDDKWKSLGIDYIYGKKVYAFCGIADHDSFRHMITSMGADLVRFRAFGDHHKYTKRDVKKIIKESNGLILITTEKDLVKLRDYDFGGRLTA
ncbi:MAG: tetraacyldisaccharide 4'-kinase, partial [Nitrospirae bacterium]